MKLQHGKEARYNLVDGSTLRGTLVYSFGWWSYKLDEAIFYDPSTGEPIPMAGTVIIPRRSIVFIQVGE